MLSVQEALDRHNRGELDLSLLSREEKETLARQVLLLRESIHKERQIELYQAVSPEARKIHLSTARIVVVTGGNRSSKTDTNLADTIIQMTNEVPLSLEDDYPREKIRCPMRVRLICESLTNTWEPVIKPKLQWNKWNGRGDPGGPFGHWGWIPRRFLLKGDWSESWSEKIRTLTLTCGCTLQVMSYDQEVEDFSGASLHKIICDEPPPEPIFRENWLRILDTDGQIVIGFTPPDDETTAIRAEWIFDLYEKGLPGPNKDPQVDSFTLFTEQNRILDKDSIADIAKGLTPAQREVRLYGKFMHLSGRIYPMYSDRPAMWCFTCNQKVLQASDKTCADCGATDVVEYCHLVEPFETAYGWPIVYLLDPHPRKANMMCWLAVDPTDDAWVVAEMDIDGDPETVSKKVFDFERDRRIVAAKRMIDPNMGETPAHNAGRRHVTVRDEFNAVGLRCDPAIDAFDVGRKRLEGMLKPDPLTKRPRLHVFNTCHKTNRQILRHTWQEWTRYSSAEKDPKAKERDKDNDYPTLLRYFACENLSFASLRMGNMVWRKEGRRGAY